MAEFSPLQRGGEVNSWSSPQTPGLGPNTYPMGRMMPGRRGQGWLDQAHSLRSLQSHAGGQTLGLRGPPYRAALLALLGPVLGVGLVRAARVKNRMGIPGKPPFLVA